MLAAVQWDLDPDDIKSLEKVALDVYKKRSRLSLRR
jgi:hypothetical protein